MALKHCSIEQCLSSSVREEDKGVTYHKYPKDVTLRKTWLEVTQNLDKELMAPIYVCSRHFRKFDFQPYKDSKFILRPDAVPSIFPWNLDTLHTDIIMEPTTSSTRSILANLLNGCSSPRKNNETKSIIDTNDYLKQTHNQEFSSVLKSPDKEARFEASGEIEKIADEGKTVPDKAASFEASVEIERIADEGKTVPDKAASFEASVEIERIADEGKTVPDKIYAELESEDSQDLSLDSTRYNSEPSPGDESDKEVISLNDAIEGKDENLEAIKKFIEEQEKKIQELEAEVKSTPKPQTNIETHAIDSQSSSALEAAGTEKAMASADSLSKIEEAVSKDHDDNVAVAVSVIDIILSESEAKLMAKRGVKKSGKGSPRSSIKKVGNGSMTLLVGSKLEAKDFSESWHPAHIVEVDHDEMEVLVHYDRGPKRHDEWISVSSPRLRPFGTMSEDPLPPLPTSSNNTSIESSEGTPAPVVTSTESVVVKEEPKVKAKLEFQPGERCLARWRDNRKFMATISADLGNDTYEITFDDGFNWTCPVTRLNKMRDDIATETLLPPLPTTSAMLPASQLDPAAANFISTAVPPYHTHLFDPTRDYLGTKSERRERKRKLNIKEIFNIGQKKKREIDCPPPPKRERPRVVRKKSTPVAPVAVKQEVKQEVKTEPAVEVPDAVASIIGTNSETEPQSSCQSPAQSMPQSQCQSQPSPTTSVPTDRPMVLKDLKIEIVKIDPNMCCDDKEDTPTDTKMEEDIKEDVDDSVPDIKDEPKSDGFESKDIKPLDTINEQEIKQESPQPEPFELSSITATFELSEVQQEAKDKNKKLSRIKKARKLRMQRERKALQEVERVKNELEEMKRQMEEMKKQVVMKKEDMFSAVGADCAMQGLSLLPGEWACRWLNGQPVGKVSEMLCEPKDASKGALPRRAVQVEDRRLPEGWTKHLVRRSLGSSAGKWDIVLISSDFRRFHTKNDMRIYLESSQDPSLKAYEHALMDFSVHRKLSKRLGWDITTKDAKEPVIEQLAPDAVLIDSPLVSSRVIKKSQRDKSKSEKKTKKIAKKKRKEPQMSSSDYYIEPPPPPQELPFDNSTLEEGYVYVGPLKVQVFENLLRCPAEGCFKNFRNHTLLCMHIKHYHRELKKIMGNTPKVLDLAHARAKVPGVADLEQKTPKIKVPRQPPRRPEETKMEFDEHGFDYPIDETSTTPVKSEPPKLQDSPKLRNALAPKRPKVLLPVKRLDNSFSDDRNDFNPFEDSDSDDDFFPNQEPASQLDFEAAISTHTVTKPIASKKKHEKKKFAQLPNRAVSDDEEYCTGNSDFETMSSFPRSGSPDKLMDTLTQPMSSESNEGPKDESMFMMTESGEKIKIVHMKREEIINCHCGIREEDGLMIQCELCLCWQHALCHNIQRISDVPEKYTCSICLNPRRGRRSRRFLHDQDRLYEGLLPGAKPCEALRRSHELSGNLIRIQGALHALRVKYYVAIKKDHPKLYLWAKDWESNDLNFSQEKLCKEYMDLSVMINDLNKENLPMKSEDLKDISLSEIRTPPSEDAESGGGYTPQRSVGQLGSQALLSGLLSSPGGVSLDLPISTSELERLAKSVQENESQRYPAVCAPQPEAPIENSVCRERLLKHIQRCQALIDARLDSIEAQVAELESQDPSLEDDESADYFPRTKQTIHMLMRDLDTMEELAVVT